MIARTKHAIQAIQPVPTVFAAVFLVALAFYGLIQLTSPEPAMCMASDVYTVKNGDTMWNIAAANNIDVEYLRNANRDESPDLKIGTRLVIPECH